MLGRDDERELISAWLESGCEQSRDRLVREYEGFIRARAGRMSRASGEAFDDAYQIVICAFMEALNRFDLSQDVRFATYAEYWVRAEMQTAPRNVAHPVIIKPSSQTRRAIALFKSGESETMTDEEIAAHCGLSVGRVAAVRRVMQHTVSGDDTLVRDAEGSAMTVFETIRDESPTPDEVLMRSDEDDAVRSAVSRALSRSSDRDREIFRRRHLSDETDTLAVLAGTYRISNERVRQIESRAYDRVSREIERTFQ